MANESKRRLVRADDFVAESLEEIARRKPPGLKAEAEILLAHAKKLRRSTGTKMVKVGTQPPGKSADE